MYNVIPAILFYPCAVPTLYIVSNLFIQILAIQEQDQMSEHYHDAADLRFLREMGKLAPTEFNAWLSLDKIVGRDDGAIPRKYRELIALGVAFTTHAPIASKYT